MQARIATFLSLDNNRPVLAGRQIGAYQLQELIGAGGMGEVYRARDTRLQRDVAIKILPAAVAADAERLARFTREAQVLASLNHPHIAQIYGIADTHTDTGTALSALVLELVEGPTLADRIAHGPVPVDEVVSIARQISDALAAAHDQGIVHRDLKPANIKVREDGTVKVLDFGLAKAVEGRTGASGIAAAGELANSPTLTSPVMTQQGVILGTAAYMAPEQARGKPVDNRADIWAFGCVLYEMLTARQPFVGETVSDTIAAILGRDPDFSLLPSGTPAALTRLLRRCLVRDPRSRLRHIADASLDLDEASNGESARLPSTPSSSRIGFVTAAAMVAAVASAAAMYLVLRATAPAKESDAPLQLAVPMLAPNSAANGVLISPDGSHLVTRGPNGVSVLHPLDGSPSRVLEHMALCWSPDSRSLLLKRSDGGLLRLNLGGGPPVVFAKTTVEAGGCSWNQNGVLLVDDDVGALQRVEMSSGTVTRIELDDGGENTRRSIPRFLPDGTHFLYWTLTADGQCLERVASLDARDSRVVVAADAPAVYDAGYLLYERGAALVAQPFDAQTLTLSGEPRALTSEAASGTVMTQFSYDVSTTGMLVFGTTNGGVKGQNVWFDRAGNMLGTLAQPNGVELLNLELSPDGTRVAGNRMDPSTGNWDIWVVDVASGAPTRITTDPGIDSDAVWSPDGSEVAYISQRRGAPGMYRRSIATGREELLLKSERAFSTGGSDGLRTTDWTRDGRFILYEADNNILALPLQEPRTPVSVVAGPQRVGSGKVSPDGHWIAFHSLEADEDYVYVQPFPGPGPRTRVSPDPGRHPRWRRDGGELFWTFSVARGPVNLRTLHSAELVLRGTMVSVSAPKPVLPSFVNIAPLVDNRGHAAIAPDGHRFLLRQAEGLPGAAVKVILNWKGLLDAASGLSGLPSR